MPEFVGKVTKIGGAAGFIRSTQGDISYNHATLLNRDSPNQHIIASITGLQDELDSKANADTVASNMQTMRSETNTNIQKIKSELSEKADVGELDQTKAALQSDINKRGTHLWFDTDNNLLYLMGENDEELGDGVEVAAAGSGGGGGGGGGSSSSYVITLKAVGDRQVSVAEGGTVQVSFTYTSVDEDGEDDGSGVGIVQVGGVTVKTFTAQQGVNTLDLTSVVVTGTNNVKIRVENSEGNAKNIAYTVNVINLNITTTMDLIASYSGDVAFNYTLNGTGTKTMHYILDGKEIDTEIVTSTGRSRTYMIAEQPHGAHLFQAYATATVNGVDVISNSIIISMVWVNFSSTVPIIASPYSVTNVTQGDSVIIPYMVYDPLYEEAEVTLTVLNDNGLVYSTKTVTRGRDKTTEDPWSLQDYPAGETTFRITCRDVSYDIVISVEEYIFPIEEITDNLVLSFSAEGRTNGEANPATWTFGEGADAITATFSGFGWDQSDGWLQDEDNAAVLRFLPGDTMTIPFKPFATDKRDTGYTIEVELATRDVRDYESVVMSCLKGGRGFKIASQEATLSSEQSSVSMLFKEDSRVRVAFVIEEQNLNRLIYIYINGIMCGVTQYPTNDNFQQASPYEDITIGADICGLDLYRIRCYSKGLNRSEQLDNFIYDRSTLTDRQAAFSRNNILNEMSEVTPAKLPTDLPYMTIVCPELPQYKGDKKTGVTIVFADPTNSSKNFEANGAEIDVQGTSSSVYPVKNEKIKLKGGLEINGNHESKYALFDDSIPVSTFCIKVDYASCEGANNVELVELYEQVCKEQGFLTPPQEEDARVRQGIAGRPIALFWKNSITNETKFIGKANLNNDKSTENVFGFDKYPNAESWEYRNNTSNICLFKGANWTATKVNDDGETYPAWQDDLEARYPEDNTDTTNIQRLYDFVLAHDRSTVSTDEEKQAMLDDFKAKFDEYFVRNNMLFYYIFTEVFLMVDSRAKNMFMTTFDGTHWLPIPYDMDTALGINNEGALAFEYNLEDTDTVDGSIVFNGQPSVLWQNVRDAFRTEIKNMYATLRSGRVFNYDNIKQMFEKHQGVWPERLWNEDAFNKYLQPFLTSNKDYLDMLQGDKSSQRDWWLYNGFKYRDSKYATGSAKSNRIILRGYVDGDPDNPDDAAKIAAQMAAADITVTPYAHVYASVDFGSYTVSQRLSRNNSYTFDNPMDYMNDTEIYINSADQLSDVGDLSVMRLGKVADFSAAKKLQKLIVGSSASDYRNAYLKTLTVGNNELLTEVNVCNCTALTNPLDLTGCTGIETVLAKGSSITGVQLPNGGHLKKLQLPSTITNLTVRNQTNLTDFEMPGYDALITMRIENTPNVPIETIINNATSLERVRLLNVEWNSANEAALQTTITKLRACGGQDASGRNADSAVVNGRVNVTSISSALLTEINENFPDLVVVVNGVPQYIVRFMNYDNTVHYMEVISEGGNATDPVATGLCAAPTRPATDEASYVYSGWSSIPTNVRANISVTAMYDTTWRVRYLNWDNSVLQTKYVANGGTASYTGSTPTRPSDERYNYTFSVWSGNQSNITAPTDIIATYTSSTRYYTVRFMNGTTVLQTVNNVPYLGSASYTGATPTHPSGSSDYQFTGFQPTGQNITGNTDCVAQFLDMASPVIKYLRRNMTAYESDTATTIGEYAFYNMSTLTSAKTTATSIGQYAFNGCTALTSVDLTATSGTVNIAANAFAGCTKITEFFIRSSSVATLAATSGLPSAAFTSGEGAIYVPANLVSSYKSATNWSTYASRIYPISAYPVTDFSTISDTWEQIIAAGNDGTYATKYSVGDTKQVVDTDGSKFYMQLVSIDGDDLADGSGKAHMTWLLKDCYKTQHRMNATGTTADGYPATEMRTWLTDTVLPTLPSTITDAIKEVTKTSWDVGSSSALTSTEKLWIPSTREVCFTGSNLKETSGVQYNGVFTSNSNRVKYYNGSAYYWWLRSAYSSTSFYVVTSGGSYNYSGSYASGTGGVVFGFCI